MSLPIRFSGLSSCERTPPSHCLAHYSIARIKHLTPLVLFIVLATFFIQSNIFGGSLLWKYKLRDPASTNLVSDGNTYYLGTSRGDLYALTVDNKQIQEKWRLKFFGGVGRNLSLVGNDLIFTAVRRSGQYLYSLDKNTGLKNWKIKFPDIDVLGPVALVSNRLNFSAGNFEKQVFLFKKNKKNPKDVQSIIFSDWNKKSQVSIGLPDNVSMFVFEEYKKRGNKKGIHYMDTQKFNNSASHVDLDALQKSVKFKNVIHFYVRGNEAGALNMETGSFLWKKSFKSPIKACSGSRKIKIYQELVIVSVSEFACKARDKHLVIVFNAKTGQQIKTFNLLNRWIYKDVGLFTDGNRKAFGLDIRTGKKRWHYTGMHLQCKSSGAWAFNNELVYSVKGVDRSELRAYNVKTGKLFWSKPLDAYTYYCPGNKKKKIFVQAGLYIYLFDSNSL